MVDLPIPYGPDEVTADWLTDALMSTGRFENISISHVSFEPIGGDKSMTGQLARLSISYSGTDSVAPKTMIAKFPASDPEIRKWIGSLGFYEREPKFYHLISNDISIRTPSCYYGVYDPESVEGVLLLEDLSSHRLGKFDVRLSEQEENLLIHTLAKFHAQWWDRAQLKENDWIPSVNEFTASRLEVYQERIGSFIEKYGDQVHPSVLKLLPDLDKIIETSADRLAGPPSTLLHGDFHVENIAFSDLAGGDGQLTPIVFDWQFVMRGMAAYDLCLFVQSFGQSNDRYQTEMNILTAYHSVLSQNGITHYSYGDLLSDYRIALVACLVRLVVVMGQPGVSIDQETPRLHAELARLCDSVVGFRIADLLD